MLTYGHQTQQPFLNIKDIFQKYVICSWEIGYHPEKKI